MNKEPLVSRWKGLKHVPKKTYSKMCSACNVVPYLMQWILYCPKKRRTWLEVNIPTHRWMEEYNIVNKFCPCVDSLEKKK